MSDPASNGHNETTGAAVSQFRFVQLDGSSKVIHTTGGGDVPYGVTQYSADAADKCINVIVGGRVKIKLGGTVTKGDFLMPAADGKGVLHVATNVRAARVLEDGVDGDVVWAEVFSDPVVV